MHYKQIISYMYFIKRQVYALKKDYTLFNTYISLISKVHALNFKQTIKIISICLFNRKKASKLTKITLKDRLLYGFINFSEYFIKI